MATGARSKERGLITQTEHDTPDRSTRVQSPETNRIRKAPPLHRKCRISTRWRVSNAYILSQNAKRLRICNVNKNVRIKYIGSRQQRERIENCRQMHTYIAHITRHYKMNTKIEHKRAGDSIPRKSRLWHLCRSLHPVRTRGKRPGRPAGPGLPHGDLTGDDD